MAGRSDDDQRAERRRLVRELIVVAALVTVVGGAVGVRELTRPPDPRTAATRAALEAVGRMGGPPGWVVTAPTGSEPPPDNAEIQQRNGLTVAVHGDGADAEAGFTVAWTPSAPAGACDALAGWAQRMVQHEAPDTLRAVCRDVIGSRGGAPMFDSYGTPAGPAGRYMYTADVRPDGTLVATLSFEAP